MPKTEREQIKGIMADLTKEVERTVSDLAVVFTRNVAEATPKASGLAAASWVPSVSRSADKPPSRSRTPAGVEQAKAAQEAGLAEVQGFQLAQHGKAFVTNAQGYVVSIEEGTSKQAPRAFVRASIDRTVNEVARRRR